MRGDGRGWGGGWGVMGGEGQWMKEKVRERKRKTVKYVYVNVFRHVYVCFSVWLVRGRVGALHFLFEG